MIVCTVGTGNVPFVLYQHRKWGKTLSTSTSVGLVGNVNVHFNDIQSVASWYVRDVNYINVVCAILLEGNHIFYSGGGEMMVAMDFSDYGCFIACPIRLSGHCLDMRC